MAQKYTMTYKSAVISLSESYFIKYCNYRILRKHLNIFGWPRVTKELSLAAIGQEALYTQTLFMTDSSVRDSIKYLSSIYWLNFQIILLLFCFCFCFSVSPPPGKSESNTSSPLVKANLLKC